MVFFLLFLSFTSSLLPEENQVIQVYEQSVQSVVNVSTKSLVQTYFSHAPVEIPYGMGSGFLWDKDHIVTNFHVVEKGTSFYVRFPNDIKEYEAKLIGTEPRKDLAVLRLIKKPNLVKPLKLGSSKNLKVGQIALAIGNPLGLDHTLTKGIISALGREIMGRGGVNIKNLIQTDASINQGNSGGPLLNSQGEVIGVTTMIASQTGGSIGLGFAVPMETIQKVIPELIKFGKFRRPGLGVSILSAQMKRYLPKKTQGVVIAEVSPNSAAFTAGLRGINLTDQSLLLGDIILKINDQEVNSLEDIYHYLDQFKIGDKVTLTILNGSKIRLVDLILQEIQD